MVQYPTIPVHISEIRTGDTIVHDGELRTVCAHNIKSGFCGITIFGDSYRLGTIPVTKAIISNKPS